jgi:hypothetical protein
MTVRLLLAGIASLALAGSASAQFQMIFPWNGNNPGLHTPPQIGTLPNGTPVVNPWIRPATPALQTIFSQNLAYQQSLPIWNPALAGYWGQSGQTGPFGFQQNPNMFPGAQFGPQPIYGLNQFGGANGFNRFNGTPYGFGNAGGFGYGNQLPYGNNPQQYEPGKFYPVGMDAAVNPVTGTVLRPYSGVAFTNEGAFYRVPGSGRFTPFGTMVPGSGVYLNPFTGVAYNPQTGAIQRP